MKRTLFILTSGETDILASLCESVHKGTLLAAISGVVVNRANTRVPDVCAQYNIPVWVLDQKACYTDRNWHNLFYTIADTYRPDLVVMTEFDRILDIPPAYEGRILGVFPAILPKQQKFAGPNFWGRFVHKEMLRSGIEITGCSVYIARKALADREILGTKEVAIGKNWSTDLLQKQVRKAASNLLPTVLEGVLNRMETR